MRENTKNILLIWDRMGDYHRARWKALQHFAPVKVFAADLGVEDNLYGWQNTQTEDQYIYLSKKPVSKSDFFNRLIHFIQIIRSKNIGFVCVPGYGRAEYIAILLLCRIMGCKVLLFAESWYKGNYFLDKLKGIFLRITVDNFLVSGERAKKHFNNRVGIPLRHIAKGYSVVDNQHFSKIFKTKNDQPTTNNQQYILLCIARFVPEKNLEMLVNAFYQSRLLKQNWHLKIVGGGQLKTQLTGLVINSQVELLDWVSYGHLLTLYHSAQCFILPSKFEPWGLVVNEAMAAGLPIILSNDCGCLPELLTNENGWNFDANNLESLVKVLNELCKTSKEKLQEMGKISMQLIEPYTPETWAKQIVAFYSATK